MSAHWLWALGLCVSLAGCGPDTVGAAATAAKLQADSAERAQAQAAKLKQDLEAAVKAAGGKVTREAGPMKHGSTVIAFVEDPDGYKIEFIQRGTQSAG